MTCSPNATVFWLALSTLMPPSCVAATVATTPRADTRLVLVSARDPQGHVVSGLCSGGFRLFENGIEQTILKCTAQSSLVSTAIVLDASGSMEPFMDGARVAIRELVRTADPEDEFSLTLVRDNPKPEVILSSERERMLDRVDRTVSGGLTALWDAMYVAAQPLKIAEHSQRAMLVVSDGGENNSQDRPSEVLSLLRDQDIAVYAIGVHSGSSRTMAARLYDLQCLAKRTGGRYFDAYSARDLPRIMGELDIRDQYVLAYAPSDLGSDGKYHRVRVELNRTGSRSRPNLSWRSAYAAPLSR